MKTSIIVCTRDRCARLKILLASIVDAERPADMELEVVVVDDGSTDETAGVVKAFAASAPFRVDLAQQPGRGLASARNLGLRDAGGDLLIFLDDDCVVSPDYLRDAAARYAADDRLVVRGGRVLLGDPEDAPVTIRTSSEKERMLPRRDPAAFIHGCNMTMTRAAADRIGLFDERFGAGGMLRAAEDTDYLVRAQLADIVLEYVPDMTVHHFHGRRTPEAVQRVYRSYNIGNGALAMKHALRAPWLLRARYWTLRNAFRELFGGPQFDASLGVSHWRMTADNLTGAWLFALAKLRGIAPWPKAGQAPAEAAPSPARPDAPARRPAFTNGAKV